MITPPPPHPAQLLPFSPPSHAFFLSPLTQYQRAAGALHGPGPGLQHMRRQGAPRDVMDRREVTARQPYSNPAPAGLALLQYPHLQLPLTPECGTRTAARVPRVLYGSTRGIRSRHPPLKEESPSPN